MGTIIGIDLGTTNSAMAYLLAGKPEVITNKEGNRTTPSVVGIKKGERLVGQVAQRQRVVNAENTIYGIKRLIGRKFSDKEVQDDIKIMPRTEVDNKPASLDVKLRNQPRKSATRATQNNGRVRAPVIAPPPAAAKPQLSRKQVLQREIANEQAALVRAQAQLARAQKAGGNTQALQQTVRDRQANVRAIQGELRRVR